MKSLRKFVEDMVMSTPLNTMGMGNITSIGNVGTPDGMMTDPLCGSPKPQKRKKKRHIVDFIHQKEIH